MLRMCKRTTYERRKEMKFSQTRFELTYMKRLVAPKGSPSKYQSVKLFPASYNTYLTRAKYIVVYRMT